MFSETFNSDDPFTNSLMDLAMDAAPGSTVYDEYPATTTHASIHYDYATPSSASDSSSQRTTRRPSILIEDDDAPVAEVEEAYQQSPPPKRMRFTNTVAVNTPYRRIPCKARGMSDNHNASTAFIHLPLDAPHGLLLRCSIPECAESGRRFRYCKVCVLPVAKRNFPKRHGHGLIGSSNDLKEVDYSSSFVNPTQSDATMMSSNNGCQPCGGTGDEELSDAASIARTYMANTRNQQRSDQQVLLSYKVKETSEEASISAAKSYMEKLCDDRRRTAELHSAFEPPAYVLPPQKATLPPAVVSSDEEPLMENLNPREKNWLTLLKERPDLENDDKMSSWMDKIIGFWPDEFAFHESTVLKEEDDASIVTPMTYSSNTDTSCISPRSESSSDKHYYHHPQSFKVQHSPTSIMTSDATGDEYFANPISSLPTIPSMDDFESMFDPSAEYSDSNY